MFTQYLFQWGDDIGLDDWLEDDFEMETVPPQMTTATLVNPQISGQCKTKALKQHSLGMNSSVPQMSVNHKVISSLPVSDSSGTGRANSGYRNESFQDAKEIESDSQAVKKTNSKTKVCDVTKNDAKYDAFPRNQTSTTIPINSEPQKTNYSGLASDIDVSVIDENLFDDMDDFEMSACGEDSTIPPEKHGGLQEVNTFISGEKNQPLLPVLRKKMFNSSRSPENIKKEITTSQPTTNQYQKAQNNSTSQSKSVTPQREEEKATKPPISIAITSPLRITNQQTRIDGKEIDEVKF